jgi:hypothetical protein
MGNYFKFFTCHKKEANNSYLPGAISYLLTCVLVENLQKDTKNVDGLMGAQIADS